MGESGGSAERRAELLRAGGDASAAAWAAGAEGERRVAEALSALEAPWVVLHDRLLTPGLSKSNLDHVVVSGAGVVLVDAKNWGGVVTEHERGLYQHRWDEAGARSHASKHAELQKVHAMAREMASRLNGPVTPVLCLAGAQAARFGPPQMVRGVWVLAVGDLVAWLRARPSVMWGDELPRLVTHVMTEFPSTTTDPDLLAAIGADLARKRSVTRPRRPSSPVYGGTPAARPAAAPARRRAIAPTPGPTTRRPPQRSRRQQARPNARRPFVALVAIGILLWGLQNGLVASLAQSAGERGAEYLTRSIGAAPSAGPFPSVPDRVSCDDLDASSLRALQPLELSARSLPNACEWSVSDGSGRTITVARIQGMTSIGEAHPMLERSREANRPGVHTMVGLDGEMTTLWVAAGVPTSAGGDARPSTRSLFVQVAHEHLGLTAKQGRRLATTITTRLA